VDLVACVDADFEGLALPVFVEVSGLLVTLSIRVVAGAGAESEEG